MKLLSSWRFSMLGMHKIVAMVLALGIICESAGVSYARLADNNRNAVVQEAFYALDPAHTGTSYNYTGSTYFSIWNYLESDTPKYEKMKDHYQCNSSGWMYRKDPGDDWGCYATWVKWGGIVTDDSFYSDLHNYGYCKDGGSHGDVGRGGECKFFANLVVYRSGADTHWFPSYNEMLKKAESDMNKALEGDVIFTTGKDEHTAIVVRVYRDSKNNVTGLDVVDSNYITDKKGASNREVIARHYFDISQLKGKYHIWKGVGYYSQGYSPN